MLNRHHLFIQEKKEFEQKFSKEQAALREQLQVRQSLHYSNIIWLLLFSGLLTTHSLHPGSHESIPSGKLGVSQPDCTQLQELFTFIELALCGNSDVAVTSKEVLR